MPRKKRNSCNNFESGLDLNSMTTHQLQQIPGIGKTLANRIVEYRKTNGGFHSINDVLNVKGIGTKRLAALQQNQTISHQEQNKSFSYRTSSISYAQSVDSPRAKDKSLLDLNEASSSSLLKITGIGIVLADRIVEYRETNGPFNSLDELLNIKGIGPIRFSYLKQSLTISCQQKSKNIIKCANSDDDSNLNFVHESKKEQHSTKLETAKETEVKDDIQERVDLQIEVNSEPGFKYTYAINPLQIFLRFVIFSLTWNIVY